MKKILIFFIVLFAQVLFAQKNKKLTFNPKFEMGFQTYFFFGDNYLSKGHTNPAIGAELNLQIISFNNINAGFGVKKTTLKVEDIEIGGNIDKSNLNSFQGFISYSLKSKKLEFIPQFAYGGIENRQKMGSKLYGVQKGNLFELSVSLNYQLDKNLQSYIRIGTTKYVFNINTTPEFTSYFKNSNGINISIGIRI